MIAFDKIANEKISDALERKMPGLRAAVISIMRTSWRESAKSNIKDIIELLSLKGMNKKKVLKALKESLEQLEAGSVED